MVLLFFSVNTTKAGRSVITYVCIEENEIREPISSKQNKWLDPFIKNSVERPNEQMSICTINVDKFCEMSCEWIISLCHVYFKLMRWHMKRYTLEGFVFSFVQLLWERVFPSQTIISVVLCTITALKTITQTECQ